MESDPELQKFDFLRQLALDLGAVDAKIIPTSCVIVENRVQLKCKVGCVNYGKSLACPPHVPTAEQFKKIVSEYHYAIFMKFSSKAKADKDLAQHLAKKESEVSKDVLPNWQKFWADWKNDKKTLLEVTLKIEKAATSKGYPLALGLVSGQCQVCEKCNVESGVCLHPQLLRYSEEGVGVNVQATAVKSGMKFTFPFNLSPESYALVLID